jgi:general secretion pathway protein I
MTVSDDRAAGFSTIEVLVAFLVLSLGLGMAVQSISLAATSLKRTDQAGRETRLVRRVMAEELPRLMRAYAGKALVASGSSWEAHLRPLSPSEPQGPVQVLIRILPVSGRGGGISISILPYPAELALPQTGEP